MISPAELNTMYRELLNYPAFISELSNYQKSKLWEYAQNMEISELREVNRMMMENPDYPYPNEYRGNGREVEYWMERSNYGRESRFVMELLRTPPVRPLDTPAPVAALGADKKSQLSTSELALLCVYAGHSITNGDAAKPYLEGNVKSGRALYNKFAHYCERSNRIGFADETAKRRNNMIARIKKVLPRLNDEQKKQAENEIHTLTAQNQ
jgi:hypothetical protein